MDTIRQTKLIVNTANIEKNISELQKFVGNSVKIMPVIKARGYGTGIGTQVDLFKRLNIDILAVAVVDEGIALRQRGFMGEIVVLNQPFKDEIEKALEYNLTLGVCVLEFIKSLSHLAEKNGKISNIHLEINTGMNRTGIDKDEINSYLTLLKGLNNISLEGIYTHFSSSDSDYEYTVSQINQFNSILNIVKSEFNLKYIHACNTGGILNFKEAHYNLVRPGISLYGHLPSPELAEKITLTPATILKTKITYIHNIKIGDSVSYNRSFIARRDTKIATIPIGYADGLPRAYKGQVVINNQLANIVGVINMDSFMVDITDLPSVQIGDDAYIWDNHLITIEDVSKACGTINYEILANLAPRVVKEFI